MVPAQTMIWQRPSGADFAIPMLPCFTLDSLSFKKYVFTLKESSTGNPGILSRHLS